MYLRLSAWPLYPSGLTDRVLTAVDAEHVLAKCETNRSPLRQSPLLFCLASPHLTFPLSFAALFFHILFISFQPIKAFFKKRFHCLPHLPKRCPLFHLQPFLIIPAHSHSHHYSLQCITLKCTILTSPTAQPRSVQAT